VYSPEVVPLTSSQVAVIRRLSDAQVDQYGAGRVVLVTQRWGTGAAACHSLCHSIAGKRVATGSHELDESVLFGLLTHELKATDCNGLDGSNHPLKVAARVRIPYGLPARKPRSAVAFGAITIALDAAAATSLCHSIGTDSSVRSATWAVARRGVLGRCRGAAPFGQSV
jgi:hypothetical protein